MKFLHWNDLTAGEQKQAKSSYLSLMEDIAAKGDECDKEHYQDLCQKETALLEEVKAKSFIRDNDGYIFVSL